jgi:hypothetical protein
MEKILLLASDAAWKALPKPLQERLKAHGAPAAGLGLPAGAHLPPRMALELAEQHADAARILIADLRCTAALARLRDAGYVAERAGNRVYGGDATPEEVAALPGDTLLEQLLALRGDSANGADADQPAGLDLLEAQAWQRDGWAGLSVLGRPLDGLRRRLLEPAHATDKHRVLAQTTAHCDLEDLLLAAAPAAASPALADLLQTPWPSPADKPDGYQPKAPCPAERNERDYEQAQCARAPVAVKPVLLLRHRENTLALDQVASLELLGPARLRGRLARLLREPWVALPFELVLTVGQHRCRLHAQVRPGAEPGAVDRLVSTLLEVALVTGRPLREYDCTLYLPLDLATDRELEAALTQGQDPDRCALAADGIRADAVVPRHVKSAEAAVTALNDAQNVAGPHGRDKACDLSYGELEPETAAAQTLLYFLPELQARIFDTESESESESAARADNDRRTTIQHWSLKLADPTHSGRLQPELCVSGRPERFADESTSAIAALIDVSLYRFYNGLCILALRLGFTPEQRAAARALRSEDADWWWPLLLPAGSDHAAAGPAADGAQPVHPQALQIERWLWLTKSVRLLRPAFAQQSLEGKLPQVCLANWIRSPCFDTADAFSPIVAALLEAITGIDLRKEPQRQRRAQIRDDRMFVNVAYALAGPAPGADPDAQDAFERLFSLALYVDHGADGFAGQDGYAYDKAFVRAELAVHADRRWQGMGSLSGSTNYSRAALGFGSFFAGPVTRVHVPGVHGRMLLLALFYELTLRRFDRLATCATRTIAKLADADAGAALAAAGSRFSRLQRSFIQFTNDHWFRTVTSQSQGVETFERITAALGLDARYALVKDKLERSDQFLEQLRGRQLAESSAGLARTANRIARGGLVIALVALLMGALAIASHDSMPSAADLLRLFTSKHPWASVEGFFKANWNFVAAALLVAFLLLLLLVRGAHLTLCKHWRRFCLRPDPRSPDA